MANGTISVSQVDVLTTSGTGTISIVPPATNTNRTLTLPDATGTIITTAGGAAISGTTGSFSGDLSFNSGYGSAAVAYGCRAWVNFNGTSTVAIRASGNVTSITDNGTGDYTVNFTTAMPDANYCAQYNAHADNVAAALGNAITTSRSTSSVKVLSYAASGLSQQDTETSEVAIFR